MQIRRAVCRSPVHVKTVMERVRVDDGEPALLEAVEGLQGARGLAQAIIHNPDVLILDELTVGPDRQIIEMRELMGSSPATTPTS